MVRSQCSLAVVPRPPGDVFETGRCQMKLHRRSLWLSIDSLINLLLGAFLVVFPRDIVSFLGIPQADSAFYPGILGAMLFGIGIALWMERRDGPRGLDRDRDLISGIF